MDCKELKLTKSACECLWKVLHEYEGHAWKSQGQCQARKGHYKTKATNMPCNTCFLSYFHVNIDSDSHLTPWRHPTWLSTEVRSRLGQKCQISNQQVNIRGTCFLFKVSSEFKYAISFLLRCSELPKIASEKNDVFFQYTVQISLSYGTFVSFVVIAFWSRVCTM